MVVELKSTPIHRTLQRVVVWFRLVALVWMSSLVTATVLDSDASVGWVAAAEIVAVLGTAATFLLARQGLLDSSWWVVIDGAATAFIVVSPGLAASPDLFYGGYGLSWIILVVWAYPNVLAGAVAIAVLVGAQVVGESLGVRSTTWTGKVGGLAVWVVSGIVYGWALWALRVTDVGREEAERRLAEERTQKSLVEARAAIADDIHDSVLQALGHIQVHSQDADMARIASDQERHLRRYLDRISAEHPDGLEVLLRAAAWEVEDRHGVPVEVVSVRDCRRSEAIEGMVAAAREAMVNAAKHSGADSISVFSEVGPDAVTVFVKDGGIGFETSDASAGHRGIDRSIVGRMERHGGSARVSSAPGRGTEVELTLPGGCS
jgi:signal transduction histidine kinase